MLTELKIKNFAIIQAQSLSLGSGLNVISGETGAGKSIILNALQLILGARANADLVRKGEEYLEVEALFDLSTIPQNVIETLPDLARPDSVINKELVVLRQVNANGRGKVYINGHLATVTLLEEICAKLITICGQNQHAKLLQATYHRQLLDQFALNKDLLSSYQEIYQAWKTLDQKIKSLESNLEKNALRRAELEFIVNELESLELKVGLREELENQVKRMTSSEHLRQGMQGINQIYSNEDGLNKQLSSLQTELRTLCKLDPEIAKFSARVESAKLELAEVETDLATYIDQIDLDEQSLANLREKLSNLAKYERKYRTDTAGLIKLLADAQKELLGLDEGQGLDQLKAERTKLDNSLSAKALSLSKSRQKAGKDLCQQVQKELAELNMGDARLQVEIIPNQEFNEFGWDKIQILIATNKGEEFKPLADVASGGELSRIMLVLKKVLNDVSGVQVLVFDEVDTGISGGVARSVGEKLKSLAKDSQVLCITHLAQVASLADRHFVVDKISGERTISVIRTLNEEERVDEIARMLAGYKITAASRKSAKELIANR